MQCPDWTVWLAGISASSDRGGVEVLALEVGGRGDTGWEASTVGSLGVEEGIKKFVSCMSVRWTVDRRTCDSVWTSGRPDFGS